MAQLFYYHFRPSRSEKIEIKLRFACIQYRHVPRVSTIGRTLRLVMISTVGNWFGLQIDTTPSKTQYLPYDGHK